MNPLWLTEADAVALLDLSSAIESVESLLASEATGEAKAMVKTQVTYRDRGTLHATGGVAPGIGLAAAKTWAHTEAGATPLLVMYDAATGGLRAVMEFFAAGQLRTAAVTGVAVRRLAMDDASHLGIIGSGKQALAQVAAVQAVRRVERVTVFSPDASRRAELARRIESELGLVATPVHDVRAAAAGAGIVVLVTRSMTPFLFADMVSSGAHVNAIGAILPSGQEFEPALLDRCNVIAVDSIEQVRQHSAEFREYFANRPWTRVRPLSEIIASGQARPDDADVTLFKAMGAGLADLAIGSLLLARAEEAGAGHPLPQPEKVPVRLVSRPRTRTEVP